MRDDQFGLLVIILVLGFSGVFCLLLPNGPMVLLTCVVGISVLFLLGRAAAIVFDANAWRELFARRRRDQL